jgi:purine-nucleoside phosphorylase
MTPHNQAQKGDIAESVLLPGDPLRAKFIAETYLQDVTCYNTVRNMLGFTGYYKGKKVSVQGTGMGIPSMSIYANELLETYGCKNLIRIGTCGAINHTAKVRDIILATGACTDSAVNQHRFNGKDYAAVPDFELAMTAYQVAQQLGYPIKTGLIFSADLFYQDSNDFELWSRYGVLGLDMEAAGLFTLTAKYRARGLCLLTVSDHILTGEATTPEERQNTFTNMMEIALEAAIKY